MHDANTVDSGHSSFCARGTSRHPPSVITGDRLRPGVYARPACHHLNSRIPCPRSAKWLSPARVFRRGHRKMTKEESIIRHKKDQAREWPGI